MKKVALGLLLGYAALPQLSAAEEAKVVVASLQPLAECSSAFSPELRSGCYTIPAPEQTYHGTPDHPAIVGWKLSKEATSGKIFGELPEPLRVKAEVPVAGVRPVYKGQGRRIAAIKNQCGSRCTYVSAQSAYGKQIARQMQRQMGVQMAGVLGFFVPFPASLAVNTLTCAAVSTGFDAKEYREDYKLEPTGQQYADSFRSNALYCSPIGGMIAAAEAKNPLRFLAALLGFSGYFWNMPTSLSYGVSAVQTVGGYTGSHTAPKTTAVVSNNHKGRVHTAAKPKPKQALVAAVQP